MQARSSQQGGWVSGEPRTCTLLLPGEAARGL